MLKEKPIVSSLKERTRYLVFEVLSDAQLTFSKVKEVVLTSCAAFMGKLGMAHAKIEIMDENSKYIIKVNHTYLDYVRACLMLIDTIDNHPVLIKSLGVSGILNKARGRYVA